jgi:hypothetical protein
MERALSLNEGGRGAPLQSLRLANLLGQSALFLLRKA